MASNFTNFTYPHTEISIDAKKRRTPIVAESDATTLLAPFVCDRGPENELVAVDSFSDFQAIFGELDYSIPNQRQILNIGRWLTGGGRVLACRLTDINDNSNTRKAQKAGNEKYIICSNNTNTAIYNSNDFNSAIISNNASNGLVNGIYYPYTQSAIKNIVAYKLSAEAKYSGTYYNSLSVVFEAKNNNPGYFDISVTQAVGSSSITVERFRNKTFSDFDSIETTSQYIGELMLQKVEFEPSKVASFALDGVTYYARQGASQDAGLYPTDESLRDALIVRINDVYSNADAKYTAFNELMSNSDKIQNAGAEVIINSKTDDVSAAYHYFVAKDLSDNASNYDPTTNYYLVTKTGSGASATYGNNLITLNGADLIERLATYVNGNENYCMIDFAEPEIVTVDIRYVIQASGITVDDEELKTPFDENELGAPTSTKYFRNNFTVEFTGGADVDDDFIYGEDYVTTEANGNTTKTVTNTTSKLYTSLHEILAKPLETPFDVMIDPGYPLTVKKQLLQLFSIGDPISKTIFVPSRSESVEYKGTFIRDDAFLYLSAAEIYGNGRRNRKVTQLNYLSDSVLTELIKTYTNAAVIKQYKKVTDIYSAESGKEVFVPLTYDLAYLVPYNDAVYGPQWPVAGLTRGVIGTKDMWINEIPTTIEKQINYDSMFNYAEKDSRGSYIMTNLTATTEDTQLKFISKSRALLKMKRQLTRISRMYLHEMNDRITKNNLQNKLDNCMADWIKNRTLSFASVEIQDYTDNDTLTNEELLLTLNIKFNNTVEVIRTSFTVA